MSLSRTFQITERQKMELRADLRWPKSAMANSARSARLSIRAKYVF